MRLVAVVLLVAAGCTRYPLQTRPQVPKPAAKLRSVAELGAQPDAAATSRAAFAEASKVLLHARCVNCHPAGDSPRQREANALHDPPVVRGFGGFGSTGR